MQQPYQYENFTLPIDVQNMLDGADVSEVGAVERMLNTFKTRQTNDIHICSVLVHRWRPVAHKHS